MYYYPREIDKKWFSISNYNIEIPQVKLEIKYCKSLGKSLLKFALFILICSIFNCKGVALCSTTLYIH